MSSGGELEFQRAIDDLATLLGWRRFALPIVQRVRTPAQVKGYPDRMYFRRGRVLVLEFKAEKGGIVTNEQRSWIDEWDAVAALADNITAAIVRPSDLERISGWLR